MVGVCFFVEVDDVTVTEYLFYFCCFISCWFYVLYIHISMTVLVACQNPPIKCQHEMIVVLPVEARVLSLV